MVVGGSPQAALAPVRIARPRIGGLGRDDQGRRSGDGLGVVSGSCTRADDMRTDGRYWGCGLGFALLFLTLIDLTHRNLSPWSEARVPRVSSNAIVLVPLLPSDNPPTVRRGGADASLRAQPSRSSAPSRSSSSRSGHRISARRRCLAWRSP